MPGEIEAPVKFFYVSKQFNYLHKPKMDVICDILSLPGKCCGPLLNSNYIDIISDGVEHVMEVVAVVADGLPGLGGIAGEFTGNVDLFEIPGDIYDDIGIDVAGMVQSGIGDGVDIAGEVGAEAAGNVAEVAGIDIDYINIAEAAGEVMEHQMDAQDLMLGAIANGPGNDLMINAGAIGVLGVNTGPVINPFSRKRTIAKKKVEWSNEPAKIICPFCSQGIKTQIKKEIGRSNFCVCCCLCFTIICTLCAPCFICYEKYKDIIHYCPKCEKVICRRKACKCC